MQKWLLLSFLFLLVACEQTGQAYFYLNEEPCTASSSKGVIYLSEFFGKECNQITPKDKELIGSLWCDYSSLVFWEGKSISEVISCSSSCLDLSAAPYVSGSETNEQREFRVILANNPSCEDQTITITPRISNSWDVSPSSDQVTLRAGSWQELSFKFTPPRDLSEGKYPLLFTSEEKSTLAYYVVGSSNQRNLSYEKSPQEDMLLLSWDKTLDNFEAGYAVYREELLIAISREGFFVDPFFKENYTIQTIQAKDFAIN